MTATKEQVAMRSLDDGPWYWVSKAVIQQGSREIGFLALAVYHYLASMVDRYQMCYPSQHHIAEKLGCSRSSVSGAIKVLEVQKLVSVSRKRQTPNRYQLLRVDGHPGEHNASRGATVNVSPDDTNDKRLTRIDTNVQSFRMQTGKPSENGQDTREDVLAADLAAALGETNRVALYRSLARVYPEEFLREVLSKVKQTPTQRIRKSRAALFTYLVRFYGNRYKNAGN